MATTEEFLTIDDVAELLKVTPRSVMRWTHPDAKDRLFCFKFRGTTRIQRSVFDNWVKARTQAVRQ